MLPSILSLLGYAAGTPLSSVVVRQVGGWGVDDITREQLMRMRKQQHASYQLGILKDDDEIVALLLAEYYRRYDLD